MSIALQVETEMVSARGYNIVEVFCAECVASIGTMDTQTVCQALMVKKRLLCPECRVKVCLDCELLLTEDEFENGAELCFWCGNKRVLDEECLSSISNLNTNDQKLVVMEGYV